MRWSVVPVMVLLACSCSDESEPAGAPGPADGSALTCEPGRQLECACPGGEQGAQSCEPDGSGWGTCVCPDASVADASEDVEADAPDATPQDALVEADSASDVEVEAGEDASDAPECMLTCESAMAECGDIWDYSCEQMLNCGPCDGVEYCTFDNKCKPFTELGCCEAPQDCGPACAIYRGIIYSCADRDKLDGLGCEWMPSTQCYRCDWLDHQSDS